MLVLNIEEKTKRCLMCADMPDEAIPDFYIKINNFPTEHDITDYLYINGEFIYDPLPEPEPSEPKPPEPTQLDVIQAQLFYTAMQTNTLIEVQYV